jgi:hypothetical protein
MAFRAGQKVVCIDESSVRPWPKNSAPVKGQVYTVREIGIDVLGGPGLRLNELELTSNSKGVYSGAPFRDAFYRANRFRPVVERKTNISIFTKMLDDVKQKDVVR